MGSHKDHEGAKAPDRRSRNAIFAEAGSDFVPSEVKSFFAAKIDDVREAIAQAPAFDPVAKAVEELTGLREYCTREIGRA